MLLGMNVSRVQWDLLVREKKYERVAEADARALPDTPFEKWGFDGKDVSECIIHGAGGKNVNWKETMNVILSFRNVPEEFDTFLTTTMQKESIVLRALLHRHNPSHPALPQALSDRMSDDALKKTMIRFGITFAMLEEAFKQAVETSEPISMRALASAMGSMKGNTRCGNILKKIFVTVGYDLEEIPWYKSTPRHNRVRQQRILNPASGQLAILLTTSSEPSSFVSAIAVNTILDSNGSARRTPTLHGESSNYTND